MGRIASVTRGLLILETVVDLIGLRRPEDTARIEADIAEITAERMQLRLKLTDGIKEENYRLAQVPFVCRDVRR